MLKRKPLLAVAVILLFLGLSCSPITAKVSLKEDFEFGLIGEDGKISFETIKLSAERIREVGKNAICR